MSLEKNPELNHVVYLGPEGSYTHAALSAQYTCSKAHDAQSISGVFDLVASGDALYGCIPLENMLEGPVAETFDALLSQRGEIVLLDSFTYEINHCIGTLAESATQVETIYSHAQALRQCASYLDATYPKARRIACPSTAAAAKRIAVDKEITAAAIASVETLEANGLNILGRSIANTARNKTRFALIAKKATANTWPSPTANYNHTTSIALDPGRDRQGILHEILQVISVAHGCNITSIHSRPDQRGGFVFFLDIEGHQNSAQVSGALDGLENYCRDTTGSTATLTSFGTYRVDPFHSRPFERIGIIGNQGAMGKWFTKFFSSLNLETIGCDLRSSSSLEQVVAQSDVLVVSVPMSEISSLSKELTPLVRPGQLVIENTSIKSSSLPILADALPEEVELLGIHTMFGATASSIRDQNVIITKTKSSALKAQAFEDLLYQQGARINAASITEHDKASAGLQALLHLLLISTAGVLEEQWGQAKNLEPFTTPNSRPILLAMSRVLRQSDSLIHDMQLLNPQSEQIRHKILSELCKQVFAIDRQETSQLDETLNRARKFFEVSAD